MKGIVESSRRRSQCGDPVVVWAPLGVEVRNQVVVVDDEVGRVRRPLGPKVEVQFQIRLEWKMGILVGRDLDEVGEEVDALEVLQDIGGQLGSTKMSAVMSATVQRMFPDECMAESSTQAKVKATWCVEYINKCSRE